jgi:hypothetical protein
MKSQKKLGYTILNLQIARKLNRSVKPFGFLWHRNPIDRIHEYGDIPTYVCIAK